MFNRNEYKSIGNSKSAKIICGSISKHKEKLRLSKEKNELRFLKRYFIGKSDEINNSLEQKSMPKILETILSIEERNMIKEVVHMQDKMKRNSSNKYQLNALKEESNRSDFSDSKKQ